MTTTAFIASWSYFYVLSSFFCYNKEMEQNDILKKMEEQDTKLEAIYKSVEKTRKYFLWTLIITLVVFILPLIGLLFAVPAFINTYTTTLGGL